MNNDASDMSVKKSSMNIYIYIYSHSCVVLIIS